MQQEQTDEKTSLQESVENWKEKFHLFTNPIIKGASSKKLVIDNDDLNKLSSYEIGLLKTIGNVWSIFEDSSTSNEETISMDKLIKVFEKLGEFKNDPERLYLVGYFFPEKLRGLNIHHINPFP
jgi:Ca2+-binding EF-hand superfamily protein